MPRTLATVSVERPCRDGPFTWLATYRAIADLRTCCCRLLRPPRRSPRRRPLSGPQPLPYRADRCRTRPPAHHSHLAPGGGKRGELVRPKNELEPFGHGKHSSGAPVRHHPQTRPRLSEQIVTPSASGRDRVHHPSRRPPPHRPQSRQPRAPAAGCQPYRSGTQLPSPPDHAGDASRRHHRRRREFPLGGCAPARLSGPGSVRHHRCTPGCR